MEEEASNDDETMVAGRQGENAYGEGGKGEQHDGKETEERDGSESMEASISGMEEGEDEEDEDEGEGEADTPEREGIAADVGTRGGGGAMRGGDMTRRGAARERQKRG